MPPRRVVGNPEYVEILEAQKAKIESRDPTGNQQYTYGRAIKSLKDCPTRQNHPGEIKVKYVGPTILAFLKAELAKGRYQRPVEGYDSLVSSSGSSSDPLSSADALEPPPRLTAKQKGKGKARPSGSAGIDLGLQAIAGKFGNGHAARQNEQHQVPRQTSAQGLCKAAAIEEAILVGLYTQCHEMSQKIWKNEKELLTLAEPWMTSPTKVLGARLLALTTRNHLEGHVRGNDLPVYSFTSAGYDAAQRAACAKGLPAIEIVQNDLFTPESHAAQPIRMSETITASPTVETSHAPARPRGIVSVPRNAPVPGNFATLIPRKRAAPAVQDTYQGLSQYTRAVAGDAAETTAVPTITQKPVNKRFTAPTIASVFHDQPTATPEAHSNILAFLFAYLDENDNRVSRRDDADVKLAEDGTPMHKVEYRTRQARHLLAKLVLNKMPMNRTPPDSEGSTEYGWMAASKAPAKCPGLTSSKATSKVGETGAVTVKKVSKSSTIASLMAGTTQGKKTDTRAMYKFPSIDTYDFGSSSSPDKPSCTEDQSKAIFTATPQSLKARLKTNPASSADLIHNIFGQARVECVNAPASTSTSPIVGPSDPTIRSRTLPDAKSVSYIPAPIASTTSSLARPAAPPHTPPTTEGYSRSYSWALEDHVTFPSFDPIILPAGIYHIVMKIDHRELNSVRKGTVEDFFTRKGINFELVNLVLGDYLWVARRKILKGDGYDEVVLAICERKRKDDFVESIKSERHVNQKRRINATGIKRCFYLVEDCDIGQDDRGDVFTKAIQTSINQTLLIDQFSLHIAGTHAETMAHLTRITRALEDEAKTQVVRVIPDSRVIYGEIAAFQRYLERKEPDLIYYTSSKTFTQIAQISATTKSLWATQVRHVCGMSEEQCVDFLDVYPTPASFFEDLEYRQACEVEAGEQTAQEPPAKDPKKWKASDPRLHVKSKVDAKDEDRPRPVCKTVSGRLWHLATAENYASMLA